MKRLLPRIFLLSTFYFLLSTLYPSPAFAAICSEVLNGVEVVPLYCIEDYIKLLITFLYPLALAITLFFLLFGAAKFVLSGGDPKNVEGAKKTLTYALLGLAVIFLIWLIFWVIKQLTGLDLTKYDIYLP